VRRCCQAGGLGTTSAQIPPGCAPRAAFSGRGLGPARPSVCPGQAPHEGVRHHVSATTGKFATSRSLSSSLGIWTSVRPRKVGHTTRAVGGPSFQAPITIGWVFSFSVKRGCLLIPVVKALPKIRVRTP
jgi:hypothetical protein